MRVVVSSIFKRLDRDLFTIWTSNRVEQYSACFFYDIQGPTIATALPDGLNKAPALYGRSNPPLHLILVNGRTSPRLRPYNDPLYAQALFRSFTRCGRNRHRAGSRGPELVPNPMRRLSWHRWKWR